MLLHGSQAELLWGSREEDNGTMLCPTECITETFTACHTDKELRRPSQATLLEFVLPLKIHFRYCWLFSGVPHDTICSGSSSEQEALYLNRTLMADGEPKLSSGNCNGLLDRNEIKAFWLTTDGHLVQVTQLSEDIKFRNLRQQNLQVALSLWNTDPELCSQAMLASDVAHTNLIAICGEAMSLSQGRFYNLYARYPLPINPDRKRDESSPWVNGYSEPVAESTIKANEIHTGADLLLELQPFYVAYFSFLDGDCTHATLRDRVSILGAWWLVQSECLELQFSLDLSSSWVTRMIFRLALFFGIS